MTRESSRSSRANESRQQPTTCEPRRYPAGSTTAPIVLAACVVLSCAAAPGGDAAQDVQVELIGERNETFPVEDPVDGSLWFSRYDDDFDEQEIWRARRSEDGWEEPETAPFSGRWGDRAPRFSPDGARLYFSSNRPVDPTVREPGDFNIWVADRTPEGWSEPRLVPAPVSLPGARDIHNAVTSDGTVYVASVREEGLGRSDIYRIDPAAEEAVNLGPPINDGRSQPDLFVAPDGSWMILVITDHPSGLGGDDLYLSRWRDGAWTAPRNLGPPVNSPEYEYGPTVSRDGRFLYFTSHRGESVDVYRVPLEPVLDPGSLRES